MSLFSAAAGIYGANKSADAMADAIEQATALQERQMRLAKQQFTPYAQAGTEALGQYQGNIGNQPTYQNTLANLVNDPGYQFRLQQGKGWLIHNRACDERNKLWELIELGGELQQQRQVIGII